jgi:hypothetical protein
MLRVLIFVSLLASVALAQSGSNAGSAVKPVPIAKARCSDLAKRETAVRVREDAVSKREIEALKREREELSKKLK